jgi:hypothetical protein
MALAASVVLALANCDDQSKADCNSAGALYEKRIAPLLAEDRPKSCNQCHLSGIDLALFAKGDPCDTMACMVEQGLVDLDQPEASVILTWIDRAAPQSEGITAQVLDEERQGFMEWIELTSACGTCSTNPKPCGEGPSDWLSCDTIKDNSADEVMAADPGDCGDVTLERLFLDSFFPGRGRCYPCHFEGYPQVDTAPKWIAIGECESASLATFRNVIDAGYINVDDPVNSLWLLKPLDEALGGIEHGGDAKFHDTAEDAYRLMLYFSIRYAQCQK